MTFRNPLQLNLELAMRMVDLNGYVTCGLIHPQRCCMGFRSSEKASLVFEHRFRLAMTAPTSMCERNSYPVKREISLPPNTVTELGEHL